MKDFTTLPRLTCGPSFLYGTPLLCGNLLTDLNSPSHSTTQHLLLSVVTPTATLLKAFKASESLHLLRIANYKTRKQLQNNGLAIL
ncbi:hypothetical protein YC2023_078075 [Brassica napus]